MANLTMPLKPTVRNASKNAEFLVERLALAKQIDVTGKEPANGSKCAICGRNPPTKKLFRILIDGSPVLLGVGRCHREILGSAIRKAIIRLSKVLADLK